MSRLLSNMNIKKRLTSSYALILVFMLILSLISVLALRDTRAQFENYLKYEGAGKETVLTVRTEVSDSARIVREMVINNNPQQRASLKERLNKQVENINKSLQALNENPSINSDEYEARISEWLNIGLSIVNQIEAGNLQQASIMLVNQCVPALSSVGEAAEKLTQEVNTKAEETVNTVISKVSTVTIVIIGLLVVSILLSVFISLKVTNGIVRPVQEVSYAAEQLSKGILNTNIEYEGKDEVGVMAESMRQSMKTLSMYIKDIDVALSTMSKGDFNISATEPFIGDFENIEKSFIKFSEEMSSTLDQINLASEQVANGSDQVSSGAQALAQGATEQAASVEDLSNIINTISEDISQNAKSAQEANELAQKTGQSIIESNEKMKEMTLAMTDISEKSNEISKIIKTIDDIAFQTNILALNAAVEAARAGTAGKGFAVVADEVRNLAQKSAEAAKNTTALIEGTVEAVENGSRIADETAKSLLEIVEDATRTTQMMVDIADASEKQAKAAENIRESISEISAVVQTNSATAEESSAASEELSGQSQVLKDLVSGFTLREGFDSSTNGNASLDFNF